MQTTNLKSFLLILGWEALNDPTMPETSPSQTTGRSVLEVLQRPDPELIPDCSWNSDLPSNSDHDMLDDVTVFKHWSDFSFPAIALAFGDILDQDIEALRPDYERVRSLSGTHYEDRQERRT